MKYELLKEVWKLRFEKMLQLEQEAVKIYEQFLNEYRSILEESRAEPLLAEVIADEKKHVRLASTLLKLAEEIQVSEEATDEAD